MSMKTIEQKRIARRDETAEYFTPPSLANEMLDKLEHYAPTYFTDPTKTFLDPACGDGNFLDSILRRKMDNKHDPLQALQTIYGCDCMRDNVQECRKRLLNIVKARSITITYEMCKAVLKNILWTPIGSTYPRGSLDYDFEFDRIPDKTDVNHLLDVMNNQADDNESYVKVAEQADRLTKTGFF